LHLREAGNEFDGNTGIIRESADGTHELAIFEGTHIATNGFAYEVSSGLTASATVLASGEASGWLHSKSGGEFTLHSTLPFYLDGTRAPAGTYHIPAGKHHWEVTSKEPVPLPPSVSRTEVSRNDALVYFTPSAAATTYKLQVSRDDAKSWQEVATGSASPLRATGLPTGKVHVRVIAANASALSQPGREYPVYLTPEPAAHPDGLKLTLSANQVDLHWGEVLGAKEYRLYRRTAGQQAYQLIYHGLDRTFRDRAPGVIPAFDEPGLSADAARPARNIPLYEYAIAAVNGNGDRYQSRELAQLGSQTRRALPQTVHLQHIELHTGGTGS
jgi:hypothetical protein